MKKYWIIAYLLLIETTILGAQSGFWSQRPAPPGGDVSIIPTATGSLYGLNALGALGAELYRSSDAGLHWTRIYPRFNNTFIEHLVDIGSDGTFYYTKTQSNSDYHRLYSSADEGVTWQLVNDSVQHIRLASASTGTLIGWGDVDTANAIVVRRSTDGGHSWTWALTLPQWVGEALTFREMPNGSLVLAKPNHFLVYHSEDDGQSWTEAPMPTPQGAEPLYIAHSGTWFALQWNTLLRSANQGQNWTALQGVAPFDNLNSFTSLPNGRLLAAGSNNDHLYYSDDDGIHWQLAPAGYAIRSLKLPAPLPDGTIFATSKESLFRSGNGGNSWTFSAYGMPRSLLYDVAAVNQDTVFAVTEDGICRTLDRGQNWEFLAAFKRKLPDYEHYTYLHHIDVGHTRLLVGIDSSVLLSTDRGASFTDITPPGGLADFKVRIGPGDSVLFANGASGLCRSTDAGAHWQTVAGNRFFAQMAFHPSGRCFALMQSIPGYNYGALWFSNDLGATWQPTNIGGSALCINPNGVIFVAESNEIQVSENGGNSWATRLIPENLGNCSGLLANAAGHLFAYNGDIIFSSLDNGITWQLYPSPADEFSIDSNLDALALGGDQYLFVASATDGIFQSRIPTTQGAYLTGRIYRDGDGDCATPDPQLATFQWAVKAQGASTYTTFTDSDGIYRYFIDTGAYSLSIRSPQDLWWEVCDNVQNIQLDELMGADTVNFTAGAAADCPLMAVDLTVPLLRRCFDNPVYVQYCNQGTLTADSAYVDVLLDAYLTMAGSILPYSPLGNNAFRFALGPVVSGYCGQFSFTVNVDCDSTALGQTHCIIAHGIPDTLCTPVPAWSGAEIRASVSCQDTTLQFQLQNAGAAPSQALDCIIIEDDVVLMQGDKSYQPGEGLTLDVPANGHTWRIESEQEPGHPFSKIALAFAEGCGGFQSLGYINQFNVDAFSPSWDQDCVENTGSYDPNDKQGFPQGTREDHFIRPGQELEYLVRFQNTGTDTAFTVVVRDTLSPWLDPATLRPGAASHPYTWALSGQGALSFTFNNIHLPDSNANEAASHGFVSFRIAQQPDAPLGAVIYNEADIYFDFNEPVRTNQTWHTVGVPVTVGLQQPAAPKYAPSEILVSPQPAETYTVLQRADGRPFNNSRFYLLDALGHSVLEAHLEGLYYRFERNELPAGLYFYRIETAAGQPAGSGRLVLQR